MTVLRRMAAVAALIAAPILSRPAHAASIEVDILDATTINFAFSGELESDTPTTGAGILVIDIPDIFTNASSNGVSGDGAVGGNVFTRSFVGFNNAPFGQLIQLRSGLNGSNQFTTGDVLTGDLTFTYAAPHGLTPAVFAGEGLPFFWRASGQVDENFFQGFATAATVPLPAAGWMLAAGLAALGFARRRA